MKKILKNACINSGYPDLDKKLIKIGFFTSPFDYVPSLERLKNDKSLFDELGIKSATEQGKIIIHLEKGLRKMIFPYVVIPTIIIVPPLLLFIFKIILPWLDSLK